MLTFPSNGLQSRDVQASYVTFLVYHLHSGNYLGQDNQQVTSDDVVPTVGRTVSVVQHEVRETYHSQSHYDEQNTNPFSADEITI